MKKLLRLNLALSVLIAAALAVGGVILVSQPADVQVMSASGYAFRLEDDTGSEIFSISDAGNADVAGTFNADGAATLGSTLDVAGAMEYGSNDLYPLAYASQSYEIQCGSEVITGENQTVTVSDITTVTFGVATLGSDPGTGAGDPWLVTVDAPDGSSGDIVVNVWQDDASAATTGGTVQWCAIGNE